MAKITKQRSRYERKQIERRNVERLNKLVDYFYNTATSLFDYEVAGQSVYYNSLMARDIERRLFDDGWCTIFRDKDGIVKVGAVSGRGRLGQYRQFVQWDAILGNGDVVRGLNDTNAVIIYNNKKRLPTRIMIMDDIKNMIDTDISLMQHVKAMRVPFVFSGTEDDMLSFKTMYEDTIDGVGAFFLDSESRVGGGDGFKVWNSGVEYSGDKLMMLYEAFENRVYTLIGIQSNRIDKLAQVGQSEVDKNDDVILVNFEAFKSEREWACKLANEIGINLKMTINKYLTKQNGERPQEEKEHKGEKEQEDE